MGTLMSMLLTSFRKGMKVKLLLSILIGVSAECYSQERQLFVGVNTGLFKYDHNIPDNNQSEPFYSMLNVNTFRLDIPESIYPNNPRGNKVAFSYSFNLAYKAISKRNRIWTFETGFEQRVSQKDMKWINLQSASTQIVPSVGTAKLTNHMIFLGVLIGKRFHLPKTRHKLDIDGGVVMLKQVGRAVEQASAIVIGTNDKYESAISHIYHAGNDVIDVQAKLNLCYSIGKFGIELGYRRGFYNYERGSAYSKSYSSFLFSGIRLRMF